MDGELTEIAIEEAKKEILEAIHDAKVKTIRASHTGDKPSRLLCELVKAVEETCGVGTWVCTNCGHEYEMGVHDVLASTTPEGMTVAPSCAECEGVMELREPTEHIFEREEWAEASEYASKIDHYRKKEEKCPSTSQD